MCLNNPVDSTSGMYVIIIPRFDFDTPEEWIIFVDLAQKILVAQNITSGLPIYGCMKRVLKGDAKAEFTQQADLVGSCTVGNFSTLMATMTVQIFPVLVYQDQKQYMNKFLRKYKTMKVGAFTTTTKQLNNKLPYFPPACL